MKTLTNKTFTAQVTFGLFKEYSNQLISIKEFKESLFFAQQKIKSESNINLSVKLRHCEILCLGQDEPSIELEFIQYPRFPQEESILKKAIITLTEIMMKRLHQNRVVIVLPDETIMLEQSETIDPKIQL